MALRDIRERKYYQSTEIERDTLLVLTEVLKELRYLNQPRRDEDLDKDRAEWAATQARRAEVGKLWEPYRPVLNGRAYNVMVRNELTPDFVRSQSDKAMLDSEFRNFGRATLANVREALG